MTISLLSVQFTIKLSCNASNALPRSKFLSNKTRLSQARHSATGAVGYPLAKLVSGSDNDFGKPKVLTTFACVLTTIACVLRAFATG